jgi:dihydrofolate reductase
MIVSLIGAMDRAGLIGDAHGLPWRLPRDLKRFRALTWGKPVIVGRTTHELVGALPGRHHIVLSRRPDPPRSGCPVAASLDDALRQAADHLTATGGDEVVVIGGGQVYHEALPRAERVYLTVVDGVFAGDTYFPWQGLCEGWHVVDEEICPADEKNPYTHRFFRLERKRGEVFDLAALMLSKVG